MTCKHFRFLLPRDDADELRDADPEPCPLCDAQPHRRRLTRSKAETGHQGIEDEISIIQE